MTHNPDIPRLSPLPEASEPAAEDLQVLADLGRELVVGHFSRLLEKEASQPYSALRVWLAQLALPATPEYPRAPLSSASEAGLAASLGRLATLALETATQVEAKTPTPAIRPVPTEARRAQIAGNPDPAMEVKPGSQSEPPGYYSALPPCRAKTILAMHLGVDGHQKHDSEAIGAAFGISSERASQMINRIAHDQERARSSISVRKQELRVLYPYFPDCQAKTIAAMYLGEDGYGEHTQKEIGHQLGLSLRKVGWCLDQALNAEPVSHLTRRKQILRQVYPALPEGQEKQIAAMYLGEDGYGEHTQAEIAALLDLNLTRPGQILDDLASGNWEIVGSLSASARKQILRQVYPALPEGQEKQMVAMYLGEDGYQKHTQKEVGERFGVRGNRVSSIMKKLVLWQTEAVRSPGETLRHELRQVYPSLPEGREKEMAAMYAGIDGYQKHTQKEIGEAFGMTGIASGQSLRKTANDWTSLEARIQKLKRLYPPENSESPVDS